MRAEYAAFSNGQLERLARVRANLRNCTLDVQHRPDGQWVATFASGSLGNGGVVVFRAEASRRREALLTLLEWDDSADGAVRRLER